MKRTACLPLAATLALCACGPDPDASRHYFAAAINHYFREHCVTVDPGMRTAFPLDVALRDGARLARFDALVGAGLLSASPSSGRASLLGLFVEHQAEPLPARHYALTQLGRRLYRSGEGFCAANYQVDRIERYADPGTASGYLAAEVSYTYAIGPVQPWTRDPQVRSAFPDLAERLDGAPRQGSSILMLTYDGWVHERDFARP